MNEVLAAVGVCEKKNEQDRRNRIKAFSSRDWELMREAENDYGESIRISAEVARHAFTWWLSSLRRRIQTGIIPSKLSFANILQQEWHDMTSAGFPTGLRPLFAGAFTEFATQMLIILIENFTYSIHHEFEQYVIRSDLNHDWTQFFLDCSEYIRSRMTLIVPFLLSPLECTAALQQLGLVTSISPASLLLWNASSPLQWGLLNRAQTLPPVTSILLSPILLWPVAHLARRALVSSYGHTPFCSEAAILGGDDSDSDAADPPAFLRPVVALRDRCFGALGWANPPPADKKSKATNPTTMTTRVTELSKLPPHFLALNLDNLFSTLAFLPLESLFLRALTGSYLGWQRQTLGQAQPNHFLPGRGPIGRLLATGGTAGDWRSAGDYASKIGLCLALQSSIDAVVWAGMYYWTRWAGVTKFYWGVA
ncbi:hypothetical protein MBLNU459_g3776t2 [Dothideomycetes sp. NU459]